MGVAMTPLEQLELNPQSLEYGDRVRTPDGRAAWIIRCGFKYAHLYFSDSLPVWEVGQNGNQTCELIMKPVLPAFFVGLLLGWLGSPHVPSSPVSQYSPLPLPPGASNVEPKAPPPGWDKILDKRFRQYTNNPADCPKYAVRYNKALLEIYQTGENEYYCIFPPVME